MRKIIYQYLVAYFHFFARLQLKKNKHATIIGVTGSAGKTSTRLAIVHILKSKGVVKHSVHANSEIGIPLNILSLRPSSLSIFDWIRLVILAPIQLATNYEHFDYYVVEMGIDSPDAPKNMATLLRLVHPHVGVVLNAGLAHVGSFDHLVKDHNSGRRSSKLIKLIAQEKMHLVKSLDSKGIAVVNIDQPEIVAELRKVTARILTYGRTIRANLRLLPNSKFSYQGQMYRLPQTGHPHSLAAAIAVGAGLGISPATSLANLANYVTPSGRGRLLQGISDSTIIDSSYNASPLTMQESLDHLQKLGGPGKKIAVLGDMRELGGSAKIAHKVLADWIMQYSDQAILFGPLTRTHTLPVLQSRQFPVNHFVRMSDLIKFLRLEIKPKSYFLFKGSQNEIFLERAVESILDNPADIARLCRRGPYWDKIRASMV